MNKLVIKGFEVPYKTGVHLLNEDLVVKVALPKGRCDLTIVDNFKFDFKKPKVEKIVIFQGSCYILGSDKYIYKLTFQISPLFKRINFNSMTSLPPEFNESLSEMYNVDNFERERFSMFKTSKDMKGKVKSFGGVAMFDLGIAMRSNYQEEFKTRI